MTYITPMISSAYVHIPFCLSKCRYCGFNSGPLPDAGQVGRYCRALEVEMRAAGDAMGKLETVYFGGGTPTVLEASMLGGLMGALRQASAGFGDSSEVTIEANPGTIDGRKLSQLLGLGFNRLSLGAQSFDDRTLSLLGRAHDARGAMAAFGMARGAGFGNIGVDLIYGIPGQTLEDWLSDVRQAMDLVPEHVSAYSLTYEPGTEFSAWREQGKLEPCDEGLEADMLLAAVELLGRGGYGHYEVSNFARPGYRSRHNLNYWRCGDYMGFGAGAHSHLGGRRWSNVCRHGEYAKRLENGGGAVGFEEKLSADQRLFEAIFLGLRMADGIQEEEFRRKWGISPFEYKAETWRGLISKGLVIEGRSGLRLSTRGMLLADSVCAKLAP